MRKRVSSGLLDEASKTKLQMDFALLEQAITRQDIKDGNQRYPAISFEDERLLYVKGSGGNPDLKKNELLATIENKGITINLLSANPCLMVEFVYEPVSINSYGFDLHDKQWKMAQTALKFLTKRFESDLKIDEYTAGSKFALKDGSVVTIKRDFGVLHVDPRCLGQASPQTNLSFPLMDRFFKHFLKIASATLKHIHSTSYSSVPFFLHVFAYLDNVFERHFKNDKLLDKKEKQRMKGVFTQMAWYSIIQKVTKYASEHCMEKVRGTVGCLKNLQPVLIRLDRESIGKLVDKFEFFAKSHGSKIMDYKIVDGMGTIFREDLAFLIGEGESAEKAWGDIMKDFVRVKDLFAFAKEFDATYLDSVQYPLTKVCGEDAAVYEHRLLNKFYREYTNLADIAKEECGADYSPPACVQDDMINRFSNRKKLQESRLGVGDKMRL